MLNLCFTEKIDFILNELGSKSSAVVRRFFIGENNLKEAALIYINPLVNKECIDRDILNPLMLKVDEKLLPCDNIEEFICKKYITISNAMVEKDVEKAIQSVKIGASLILIDGCENAIIAYTIGGEHRAISDPVNESAIKGSREGFVENLDINISILRRGIKDKNLAIEQFIVGQRSQSELAIVYIEDIVDKDILNELVKRINAINIDYLSDTGMLKQYIEDNTYTVFPQAYGSERPDIIKANLMEGRIAVLLEGSPYVITIPAIFQEFFQAIEDYNQRTVVTSFVRILRLIAIFLTITLSPLYLTLINYNVELIPIKFITPIIEFRKGVSLTPFLEILIMDIVVEFLREGGVRLPPRIGQTLSIVGGIIIGNAAVQSKIVSPTTLLVIGLSVATSFLIPNYEMSLGIRFIRFPMLFAASAAGFLGIAAVWFFLIIHLCSLESFGVPYLDIKRGDLKDTFIRSALWKMNNRPEAIPVNDKVRQTDFRKEFGRKKDE